MTFLTWLHRLIVVLYLVLPALALVVALVAHARGRRGRLVSFAVTVVTGALIGLALNLIYMKGTDGRLVPTQVALAGYFAVGLLVLLKVFDFGLTTGLGRLFGVRPRPAPAATPAADDPILTPSDLSSAPKHQSNIGAPSIKRVLPMTVFRVLILFGLGLPYVMATVMTYRPKVAPPDNPRAQLGFNFQRVEFPATDGTRLVGWFIPAPKRAEGLLRGARGDATLDRLDRLAEPGRLPPDQWGRHTVLVCHGLAASKANQLLLAREFPANGYNVLIFDFRAHGESGGQLTTFGDRERQDVLGAVRWLREQRPEQSQRIVGVGASMGAAALLAAAGDDSPEGRAIDAVAVYGTYDDLGRLAHSVANQFFLPPMDWLVEHLAVPLASAQTGSHLRGFAPARLADDLWPRPLLVIHGVDDEIIPFEHGRDLFDAANPAKYRLWLTRKSHNDILEDDDAARAVLQFFKVAEDVPVI